MSYPPVKSWLDRLLEFAIVLAAIGLLLNWAWHLIRPLVPVIVITAAIAIVGAMTLRRLRGW